MTEELKESGIRASTMRTAGAVLCAVLIVLDNVLSMMSWGSAAFRPLLAVDIALGLGTLCAASLSLVIDENSTRRTRAQNAFVIVTVTASIMLGRSAFLTILLSRGMVS